QVFEVDKNSGNLRIIGTASKNEFVTVKNYLNLDRRFVINAIDTIGRYYPSNFSDPIVIYETNRASPVYAVALSSNQIQVCYNGRLSFGNISTGNVKILNEFFDLIKISSILPANDTSFIIVTKSPLEIGKYAVVLDKFRDYWGNYTSIDTISFIVDYNKSNDSTLVYESYSFIDRYHVSIDFPLPLDSSSALNISNYLVHPFGSVVEVSLASSNTILITLSTTPNIYSLGKEFFLVLGKIYTRDSTRFVQPPYNTVCITRSSDDLESSFVYPNPLNLNLTTELTFANIPNNAKIEIYDKQFSKIFEFENNKWLGGIKLDLMNLGIDFSPGIYYFKVSVVDRGNWKSSTLKKFAIIK
ncbi:MAG: hypothetical protein ACK4SO_02945, partial [Candidatus Kapaibacteriota bacterium]